MGLCAAAVTIACRPPPTLLPVADVGRDDVHVVAVAVGPEGEARATFGPELFRGGARAIDVDEDALGVVAFVARRDALRDLDGEPLDDATWRGLAIEDARAAPQDGACGGCRVPVSEAPIVVAPGDRCAPSPAIEHVASLARPELVDEAELVAQARRAVVLRWGGTCGAPTAGPLAEVRRPIVGGCVWRTPELGRPARLVAADPRGDTLALAANGIPWTLTRANGRVVEGVWSRPGDVRALATAGPGLWMAVLSDAEGTGGLELALVEAVDDALLVRDTLALLELGLTLDHLVFLPDATGDGGRVVGAGAAEGLQRDVAVLPCRAAGGQIRCQPRVVPERTCRAGRVPSTPLLVEGWLAWPTRDGALVATDDTLSRVVCVNRASRDVRLRGGQGTFAIEGLAQTAVTRRHVFACVNDGARSALLVAPYTRDPGVVPDATAIAARIAAAPDDAVLLQGVCVGFVAREEGRTFALTTEAAYLLGLDGSVTATVSPTPDAPALGFGLGASVGPWVDVDGTTWRLDAAGRNTPIGPPARPSPRLRALAAVDDGFVALPDVGPPLAIAVDPTEARVTCAADGRARFVPLVIDGLGEGPWGAWAEGVDGAWWTWADAPRRLVEVDLRRRVARTHPIEPTFDIQDLALSGPTRGVLLERRAGLWRFDAAATPVRTTPLALEGWTRGTRSSVERVPRLELWGAPGVVWLAGEFSPPGRTQILLGRVTGVDAVADAAPSLPFDVDTQFDFAGARFGGARAVASDALLMTAFDVFQTTGAAAFRASVQQVGPLDRPCADGDEPTPLGRGLGLCLHPHAASASRRTDFGERPTALSGPAEDPVVFSFNGHVVDASGGRLGTGLETVVRATRHPSGVVGALDPRGHLFIGHP